MYQRAHPTRPSATNDFLVYGDAGLGLNRATERGDAERHQDQLDATMRVPDRLSMVRRWLGEAMIGLGTRMAGASSSVPSPRRATPEEPARSLPRTRLRHHVAGTAAWPPESVPCPRTRSQCSPMPATISASPIASCIGPV